MEPGIMQTCSTIKLKRCLGTWGLLLTCMLFSGCSHLSYVDPNPSSPYAFPASPPSSAASSPAPAVAPVASLGQPPVIPVARNTDLAPVSAASFPNSPTLEPSGTLSGGSSLLRVGDSISVTFLDLPTPIQEVKTTITEDGKVTSLPFGVIVQGAGKTPSQVQDAIHDALVPKYFVRLTAAVKTAEFRYYFVGGEVKIPNRQVYQGDMTVLRAIDTAGGFTDFANKKNIELRRADGSGKFTINYSKALENPKLDLPVYAMDQITVHKKGVFGF
jgi:polysaccharide export outer membrane protein